MISASTGLRHRVTAFRNFTTMFFFVASAAFGSIPWMSLLKNLLNLKLAGLPMAIVSHYERLRDATVAPLLSLLRDYGISLPPYVIDLALVYLLLAIVVARSNALTRRRDRREFARDPDAFRARLQIAATATGIDSKHLIERVEYGLKPGLRPWLYAQYRAWRAGLRWPIVVWRNMRQVIGGPDLGAEIARGPVEHMALALAGAVTGCALYLLLSHLSQ